MYWIWKENYTSHSVKSSVNQATTVVRINSANKDL